MSKGTPIRLGLLALTAAALTLATAGTTLAGLKPQWQGKSTSNPTGSTDWFDANNWSTTAVPLSTDDYDRINEDGAIVMIDGGDAEAKQLYLADATANVTLNIADTGNTGTSLSVTGEMDIGRRGSPDVVTVNQFAGTVTIGGSLKIGSYNSDPRTSTYDLQAGSLSVTGGTSLGAGTQATGYFTQTGGTFNGDGFFVTHGELKLDGSTGSFDIADFTMNGTTGATLAFALDAGGVTAVTSTGNVSLQGILDVSLDGYAGSGPVTLIDYSNGGSLDGTLNTFTTINLHGFTADIDYTTGNQVRLTNIVTASAPEPASAALLLLGAGGLMMIRRKGIEA